jgi:hypothetical protein
VDINACPHPVRTIVGLGCAASALAIVLGASASPAASPTRTLRLGPRTGSGQHGRIAIQGRGRNGRAQAIGWASSNWSGYAITTSSASPYTGITGHWRVPTVARSRGATYSAAWAGIDGFNSSALIQTGTEQDDYGGSAHYAAWWTTSAQGYAEQVISKTVVAGDAMSATIAETPTSGVWTITLTDTTRQWSFSTTVNYTGPGTSAEWVMEAPTISNGITSNIAPIAHYGSPLTFDPGTVSVAGHTPTSPGLIASDGGELIQGYNQVVSIPSAPDADADGFNMAYGQFAPAPPSS